MVEIEVWVLVDENGDCGTGLDEESATSSYNDDIGGCGIPCRMIRVKVGVPFKVPTLTGVAPAEGEGQLSVQA